MSLSFFKQHRGSLKRIIHFTSAEVLCVLSPSAYIHHKTCWRSSHVSCFYHLGLWCSIFPFKPSNCSMIVILLQSMHWEMQFCSIKWHCIVWWTTLKYNYIYIKHTCCQCSAMQVKLNSVVLQISTTTGLTDSCTATWTKLQFLCNSCSFHISLYTVENLFIVVTYHILWHYWYSHCCYCSQTVIFCYFIMYTFFHIESILTFKTAVNPAS